MELNINATAAAQRSAFVAPTLGGAWGGLCPELGFRRFDVHTAPDSAAAFGDAVMATGHRPWRHLIT
jgi:hypothetical protein